ncbi:SDR family oxidoreductase [Cellulomonas sp. URHE0023]|uniref:SDR family NAD(P)-dependent oxidoreductase n=1 Tax=Cellulomonas sp. URHE0023 TaxID=1380354 RepID=UPI000487A155|nr:SDR family NAD(P)-dependent oxidoreductase [Cellulomonas sp. URHE0023]
MRAARDGRVVVLVGASSGIGRATAHRLARRGDALVLSSRSRAVLDVVARECQDVAPPGWPGAYVLPTDVTDRDAVEVLLRRAVDRFGRVDAVMVSAAVVAYGRFVDVPADVFDRAQLVNLLGTANVARAALDLFTGGRGGHLVVVGSLLGRITTPWMSSYVAGKWGVHGLTRTLQQEMRREAGVHVSLVAPGSVDTPVYSQAGSYSGRVGRPPPPVVRPEAVARAVERVLEHPRPMVSVGAGNALMVTAFRLLPRLFDALVTPLMSVLGLSRDKVAPHSGNVWSPTPEGEAVHGRWGRQWLRLPLAAGVAVSGIAVVRALRRAA